MAVANSPVRSATEAPYMMVMTMPSGGKSARVRGMPMISRSRFSPDSRLCAASRSPVTGLTADHPRPAPIRLSTISPPISHKNRKTGSGRRLPIRSTAFRARLATLIRMTFGYAREVAIGL